MSLFFNHLPWHPPTFGISHAQDSNFQMDLQGFSLVILELHQAVKRVMGIGAYRVSH